MYYDHRYTQRNSAFGKRVAIAPDNMEHLQNLDTIIIEKGAGEQANLADSAFMDAGARIVDVLQPFGARVISSSK